MSRRLRLVLALLGFALICLSAAALAYVLSPTDRATEQAPLAPTLFVPPQSSVVGQGDV